MTPFSFGKTFLLGLALSSLLSLIPFLKMCFFVPVLFLLPFKPNELVPKLNFTVGMWTNSGREVVVGVGVGVVRGVSVLTLFDEVELAVSQVVEFLLSSLGDSVVEVGFMAFKLVSSGVFFFSLNK